MPHPHGGTARPTIGACIMARNEAHQLLDCLETLQGFDDILVLDVGSTDQTAAIAMQAGARVLPFADRDDYGAARNALIEAATADWLLMIDADERLEGGADAVRASIATLGGARIVLCPVRRLERHGQPTQEAPAPRLFPRHAGLRYKWRIFEQLHAPRQQPLEWRRVDQWALRQLDVAKVWNDPAKLARYVTLADALLVDEPRDPLARYYAGGLLRTAGRLDDALAQFEIGIRLLPPGDTTAAVMATQILAVLGEQGHHGEVVAQGQVLSPWGAPSAEFWLLLGQAQAQRQLFGLARQSYQQAQTLAAQPAWTMEPAGARSWRPLAHLAELAGLEGHWSQAWEQIAPLAAEHGDDATVQRVYVQAALGTGRYGEAEALCARVLDRPDCSHAQAESLAQALEAFGYAGQSLLRRFADWPGGFTPLAQRLTANRQWHELVPLSRRWPDRPEAAQAEGMALFHLGRLDEAARVLTRACQQQPTAETWHNLGMVQRRQGQLREAVTSFEQAVALDPHALAACLQLARLAHDDGDREAWQHWAERCRHLAPHHPETLAVRQLGDP